MHRQISLCLRVISLLMLSCVDTKKSPSPDMYEASELAELMRQMDDENRALKNSILNGLDSVQFPSSYLALNTSEPTQEGTVNETYKAFSALYFTAMNELEHGDSNLVYRFNNGVSACISCHEQFCAGPLDRIESLFIRD